MLNNYITDEDLTQETFFRAHLYIENYQAESIRAWLFTVAHHAFIDHYRKQKRMTIKEQHFFTALFDEKNTTEETVIIQDEIQEIIEMIKDLPKKHQLAVLLYDFHELSYREAAEVMGIKESHFKVCLFRGRQAIRTRKEQKNE